MVKHLLLKFSGLFVPILFFFIISPQVFSEGTAQIMPNAGGAEKILCADPSGETFGFAWYGCPDENRLCIRIAAAGEIIYFGFNKTTSQIRKFRILDPNDNIVVPETNIPISGDDGYISQHANAVAGPNQIVGSGGYDALSYVTETFGDYYIEFNNDVTFLYFDITVASATNIPIPGGRIWSKAWQFDTGSNPGSSNGTFFIYTDDGVVTSMDLNGLQGITFTVACNQMGCPNPSGSGYIRQSVNGKHVVPQFKIFLKDPDIGQFPTGELGTLSNLLVTWHCNGTATISFDVTKGGDVDVLLDINPAPGMQAEDVLISQTVTLGANSIEWNGMNGIGIQVPNGTEFNITVTYIIGLTNFPVYDVEANSNGLIVSLVRPSGNPLLLYWDDEMINPVGCSWGQSAPVPTPIANLDGCPSASGCHRWTSDGGNPGQCSYGNQNTMNTYWYAVYTTYDWPDFIVHMAPGNQDQPNGSANVCAGASLVTYSITEEENSESYEWEYTGTGVTFNPAAPAGTIAKLDFALNATSGNLRVRGYNSTCGYGPWSERSITVTTLPSVTNTLTDAICSGENFQTTLTSDPATSNFSWTVTCSPEIALPCPIGGIHLNTINDLISLTGSLPGSVTYHITPALNSCDGETSDLVVTVNPLPVPVFTNGEPSVCHNIPGNVYETTTGKSNYIWTIPPEADVTAGGTTLDNTVTLTWNTVGSFFISINYTDPETQCTASSPTPYAVTVNQTPTATVNGTSTVCLGADAPMITFTGSDGTAPYTFTYSMNGGAPQTITTAAGNSVTTSQGTGTAGTFVYSLIDVTDNNGCSQPQSGEVTITVNPIPDVNSMNNHILCNGATFSQSDFSGSIPGTVFNWENNTPSIGLAASGTGNIDPFTANNFGLSPVVATITVTPTFTYNGVTCAGTPLSYDITVNPSGDVTQPTDMVVCDGASTSVTFASSNTGGTTTYAWTNDNTDIGLVASGTDNIPSFNATNTGLAPIVGNITVTPTFTNGGIPCTGTPQTFTITVNPEGDVTDPADMVVCNEASTTVAFATSNTGGTTTYAWTNSNTDIGLAASGTGNITSFNATNTGLAPILGTITVTPTFTNAGVSCAGTPQTFSITVNPSADVTDPTDMVVCNEASTAVAFASSNTGGTTTYAWTNSNTDIGLPASGSGNITSFNATNTGLAPILGTITVTPTFTNEGVACDGPAQTFTITVNPEGDVTDPTDMVVCNEASTSVAFATSNSGGITSYAWTNDNTDIGLAAAGPGDIPAFNATNTGLAPIVGNITVTPTFTNEGVSCVGPAQTFSITVNPEGDVTDPANQVLCNGASTSVTFASSNTGGTTTYEWTNDNIAINLPANGAGDIPTFGVTNTGLAPIVANITVTPTFTNGAIPCVGPVQTFTITVNPEGDVTGPANQVLCNGASTSVTFASSNTGGTTTYAWVNDNTDIGLAAGGNDNIPSFTVTNTTNAPITATITVTPTFTNSAVSCDGPTKSFTITVNPTPTVDAVTNQTVCQQTSTAEVNFSGFVPGTVYEWGNSNTAIGLGASGSGTIPAFTATNATLAPITGTIIVTPSFSNGGTACPGSPTSFTITVNPKPDLLFPATPTNPQEICSGTSSQPVTLSSSVTVPGVSYAWTAAAYDPVNPTPDITGFTTPSPPNPAAIPADNITSLLLTQGVVKYTVTPYFNSPGLACPGDPLEYQTLVNPSPSVALNPTDPTGQTICSGQSSAPITFTPNATPVIYAWEAVETVNLVSVIPSGDIDNIPAQTLSLTGLVQGHVKYKVTPSYQGGGTFVCPGGVSYSTIFVNPLPTPAISGAILTCELGPEVTYSTPHVDGNSYAWSVTGGTIASGAGTHQITIQWGSYTASPGTITLTETITATGCLVTTPTYQVTLQQRPIPTLAGPTEVCTGSTLNVYNSDAGNFNYTWTINGGTFTGGSTSTSPSATVTWNAAGTNWIEVNYQNALGCPGFPAKRINVLVNPLPVTTITQGAGPDCNGQTHTYQTPLDLACTYTWSATPGTIVGGQSTNNASISWLAAGPATVAVTGTYIGTTGCTSSSTFSTTVFPSPTPTFTACFDLVTTQNAKPILLKGGLPLGGEFQGNPAISYDIITGKYWFNPASALIVPGVHPITYRSQNSYGCANTSSEVPITLLPSNATFTCNTPFTDPRDGKSYATVMLGSQCWFRENLRYSAPSPYTSTAFSSPQSDNCTFERYCLAADPTCTSFGGFYQWNELMQYNDDLTTSSQGFCPPGWHVPSATEWQNMIDASQGPGVAGGALKDLTATQSFRAILGGIGYLNNIWSFTASDAPNASLYWTSTLSGNKPMARGLNTFNPSVSIYEGSSANAFPVRCVKDN